MTKGLAKHLFFNDRTAEQLNGLEGAVNGLEGAVNGLAGAVNVLAGAVTGLEGAVNGLEGVTRKFFPDFAGEKS